MTMRAIAAVAICLFLAACDDADDGAATESSETPAEETTEDTSSN